MAAPIASQVLGEVLPYLEVQKDNQQEEEKQEVEVPSVVGMTEKEAKTALEEVGLSLEVKENSSVEQSEEEQTDNSQKLITEQLPKAGIKIKQGTSVVVYK